MRAIRLSVRAFGPYLEKQTIDFEMLGNESIFLITGPTGAGKTTIFDAICYALYGRASGSDRDQDSLRSHFAAIDVPTEVEFRFALNNNVYEIIRNPKQQKKKERGEGYTEEPAKAILYEIVNGEKQLLSSRIKDVNESIEEKLGFDYEQFRKMVLIPQGEFRKLISENSKEREAILQKIFRTHFYEKMTEELKLQAKELEAQVKKLESDVNYGLSKIDWQYVAVEDETTDSLLSHLETEIEEARKIEAERQETKRQQQEKLRLVEEKLRQASLIEEKFNEQEALLKESDRLEQMKESVNEKERRLHHARIAQQIIPLEEQSAARQTEWQSQLNKLTEQKNEVNRLKKELDQIKLKYEEAAKKEEEREKLKEEIKHGKQQIEYVETYLTMKKKQEEHFLEKANIEGKIKSLQTTIEENEIRITKLEKELSDEAMLTKAFYETKDALSKQEEIKATLDEYQVEYRKLVMLRQQYTAAHQHYQYKQEEIKQLREKCDTLEHAQKEQFAGILANQLKSGEACPVCGSTNHPNKAIHDKVLHDFDEIEELKLLIQKKEAEFGNIQQDFIDQKTLGQTQRSTVDKIHVILSNTFPNFNQEIIHELNETVVHEIQSLKQKLEGISVKQKEIEALQLERKTLQNKNKELKQTFDLINDEYKRIHEAVIQSTTKLEDLKNQLPDFVQEPNEYKLQLVKKEELYERIMKEWELLKAAYEQKVDMLNKQTTILEQLQVFEEQTKKNFEDQNKKFLNTVERNGFSNLEAFQKAKLSVEMQTHLSSEIEEYQSSVKRIHYRLLELRDQLAEVERADLENYKSEVEANREKLEKIQEGILGIRNKIKHDTEILEQMNHIMKNMKDLEDEYYVIGTLSNLSSGNNSLRLSFERYVLASFLDEILLQANLRLDRMTDHRYELIRSGEVAKRGAQSGLDLEVMDHHTGITRSVKTLSGGEGFKAALSLALGLADVVQAHAGGVQLDTLFIDEGFGTLDEISLQQAIDCLKDLQESNRLLGIISHVPALKNEIHTKLVITPSHRGSNLNFTFGK